MGLSSLIRCGPRNKDGNQDRKDSLALDWDTGLKLRQPNQELNLTIKSKGDDAEWNENEV